MSLMKVSHDIAGTMHWKIIEFTSPLTSSIHSAQTRMAEVHMPIKAQQQTLQVQIQTSSIREMRDIQAYVRHCQHGALEADTLVVESPLCTLWWPQRGIDNWTGIPLTVQAGGERFIQAATLVVQFMLVDSLLSERTFSSSTGTPFSELIVDKEDYTDWDKPRTPPPPQREDPRFRDVTGASDRRGGGTPGGGRGAGRDF